MTNTQVSKNLAEGRYAGEFIVSEANGNRSRETATFDGATAAAADNGRWEAGTVLELATGKWIPMLDADPSVTPKVLAVLFDTIPEPTGDWEVVIVVRDAEVNITDLVYEAADATNQGLAVDVLANSGIIARNTRSVN